MSLSDLRRAGWLTEHETTREEIAALLALADRDLRESQTPGLGADWRLNIAYNGALQAATAALAACGFRVGRTAHHYRTIQTLTHTIGTDEATVAELDAFRQKRNQTGYERAGVVSEQEADEMLEVARRLRGEVEKWLRQKHPGLLGGYEG